MAVITFPKPLEMHQNPPDAPRKTTAHPVDVYLGRMAPASARGFLIALNNIAEIISNGTKDCYQLDWAGLTYQDTARAQEGLADVCDQAHMIGLQLCRTCQAANAKGTYHGELCCVLRDIYPHSPTADPPNPNPFEWAWYKCNGYPVPPPDWPKNRNYRDPLGDDVEAKKALARPYYEQYGNPCWDLGYGQAPDWYVRRNTNMPQKQAIDAQRKRPSGKKQCRVEAKVKLAFALCSVCDRYAFARAGS